MNTQRKLVVLLSALLYIIMYVGGLMVEPTYVQAQSYDVVSKLRTEHVCASPKFEEGRVTFMKAETVKGSIGVRFAWCGGVVREAKEIVEIVEVVTTPTPNVELSTPTTPVVTETPDVEITETPVVEVTPTPIIEIPVTPVVTEEPTQPVVTPEPTDPPVVETEEPASQPGNPGNDKPVGNAGEKCEKGMCENGDGTGEHGNSDNPDKGNDKPVQGSSFLLIAFKILFAFFTKRGKQRNNWL